MAELQGEFLQSIDIIGLIKATTILCRLPDRQQFYFIQLTRIRIDTLSLFLFVSIPSIFVKQ